jgi:serine/threonine protein kinase
MPTVRAPNSEPIPGYRLIEPLGRGGFGEVWKCEAPGGLFKAIKIVPGRSDNLSHSGGSAERELRALQHIKTIRHPFLLAMDRVEMVGGDLLVVMELADKSLHDLLQECRSAGQPGIPRVELLSYLREAAEVLDLMNQQYRLQHLDIKPRNLFLVHQHVKVADFGLVGNLREGQEGPDAKAREAITPLYAAPETFLGKITLYSDQYSLAISYQELLTGALPFTGKNARQLAMAHVQGQADLTPLPEGDRPIVGRALARESSERFASCLEFVRALQGADAGSLPPVRPTRITRHDFNLDALSATTVTPSRDSAISSAATSGPPRSKPRPPGSVTSGVNLVPGLQLLEYTGRLPAGEGWKAITQQGDKRLVKLILAPDRPDGDADRNPIAMLKGLRHEALAPLEILPCPGQRLALITDPGEGSLQDLLKDAQEEGPSGIPRPELLGYLRTAAEALDALHRTYHFQHLGLNPRTLVLQDGQLRILDYGLIELLWIPAGFEPPAVNTRYCAPELFARQSSRACDLYSLALIYQEMLTGVHPFRNLSARQLATAKLRGNPDVGLLSGLDRRVVLRALHLNPAKRYRSCSDFVAALDGDSPDGGSSAANPVVRVPAGLPDSALLRALAPAGLAAGAARPGCPVQADDRSRYLGELRQVLAAEVAAAAVNRECGTRGPVHYILHKAGSEQGNTEPCLTAHCFGLLVAGTIGPKLKGFQRYWDAQLVDPPGGRGPAAAVPPASPRTRYTYLLHLSGSLWQRALGRQTALEVCLDFKLPQAGTDTLTDVAIRIRARGYTAEKAVQLLANSGPPLLESLRKYLHLVSTERRSQERLPYPAAVQVFPLLTTAELGPPIAAQGKDLTTRGMGLYLPCHPMTPFVYLQITPAGHRALAIPAHVVQVRSCPDGRFEVGTCFALDEG